MMMVETVKLVNDAKCNSRTINKIKILSRQSIQVTILSSPPSEFRIFHKKASAEERSKGYRKNGFVNYFQ